MIYLYRIDTQGITDALEMTFEELPHPVASVLDPFELLSKILRIAIGYQDRTRLLETEVGKELLACGVLPHHVTHFTRMALFSVEKFIYEHLGIRLSVQYHTYVLDSSLTIYGSDTSIDEYMIPESGIVYDPTPYQMRVMEGQREDLERDEFYNAYPQR